MTHATTHRVPAGTVNTMTQAFAKVMPGVSNLFTYNLLDALTSLHCSGFKDRLLGKVAFACDAYIGITLQKALSTMKEELEVSGTAPWDSYQAFRAFVSGMAASEQTMQEAGMEVRETRAQLQRLFNMRTACHDAIATVRGATPMDATLVGNKKDATIYAVPNIELFFKNPRLRRDDAKTMAKKQGLLKNLASNEDGVIDAELLTQLTSSFALKSEHKRVRDLEFDRQRGELTAMLFRAFELREYAPAIVYEESAVDALRVDGGTVQLDAQDVVERAMIHADKEGDDVSPVDPFGDLDAETQYRLLHGMIGRAGGLGYIKSTLADATDDWNVEFEEHAKWIIESRPLTKAVREALEHQKFANIGI